MAAGTLSSTTPPSLSDSSTQCDLPTSSGSLTQAWIDHWHSRPLCVDDFAISATPLGTGNFSTVYRAVHRASHTAFALKVVDRATVARLRLRHPNITNELLQEKAVGGVLSHPCIARLAATFKDDASLYFLHELIHGPELWTLLTAPATTRGLLPRVPVPMDAPLAAAILAQLVHALSYLHGEGIVHRDLKPENILIEGVASLGVASVGGDVPLSACSTPQPLIRAVLIDFGTAKDLVHTVFNCTTSDFAGTPDYMPPEAILPAHSPAAASAGDDDSACSARGGSTSSSCRSRAGAGISLVAGTASSGSSNYSRDVGSDAVGGAATSRDDTGSPPLVRSESEPDQLSSPTRPHRPRHRARAPPAASSPAADSEPGAAVPRPSLCSDTRADLWSLGCVAFHMLAGVPPFRSVSAFVTFQHILAHDAPGHCCNCQAHVSLGDAGDALLFPAGVNPVARDCVIRLLRRSPSARLGAGRGPLAGAARRERLPSSALSSSSSGDGDGASANTSSTGARIDYGEIAGHPFLLRATDYSSRSAVHSTHATLDARTGSCSPSWTPLIRAARDLFDRVPPAAPSLLLAYDAALLVDNDSLGDADVHGGPNLSLRSYRLLHILALRRRIHAVPLSASLHLQASSASAATSHSPPRSGLRSLRFVALERLPAGVESALLCLSEQQQPQQLSAACHQPPTGGARSPCSAPHWSPCLLGEWGPREVLAWNIAPRMYVTTDELRQRAPWFTAAWPRGAVATSALCPRSTAPRRSDPHTSDLNGGADYGSDFAVSRAYSPDADANTSTTSGSNTVASAPAGDATVSEAAAEACDNVAGWHDVSGQTWIGPHFYVVCTSPRLCDPRQACLCGSVIGSALIDRTGAFVAQAGPVCRALADLRAFVLAVNGLSHPPRAVIVIGQLAAGPPVTQESHDDDVPSASVAISVGAASSSASTIAVLHAELAQLRSDWATSVIVAGEELGASLAEAQPPLLHPSVASSTATVPDRNDSRDAAFTDAANPACSAPDGLGSICTFPASTAAAGSSRDCSPPLSLLHTMDRCTGAWMSGVRALLVDPAISSTEVGSDAACPASASSVSCDVAGARPADPSPDPDTIASADTCAAAACCSTAECDNARHRAWVRTELGLSAASSQHTLLVLRSACGVGPFLDSVSTNLRDSNVRVIVAPALLSHRTEESHSAALDDAAAAASPIPVLRVAPLADGVVWQGSQLRESTSGRRTAPAATPVPVHASPRSGGCDAEVTLTIISATEGALAPMQLCCATVSVPLLSTTREFIDVGR